MYCQKKRLRLVESDASGALYFAEQFTMAESVFEDYLEEVGLSIGECLKGDYLLPIVRAEADFIKPVRVGDGLEIRLQVVRIGEHSFTLKSQFLLEKTEEVAGHTSIVHVAIDQKTRKSIAIPKRLKEHLQALQRVS